MQPNLVPSPVPHTSLVMHGASFSSQRPSPWAFWRAGPGPPEGTSPTPGFLCPALCPGSGVRRQPGVGEDLGHPLSPLNWPSHWLCDWLPSPASVPGVMLQTPENLAFMRQLWNDKNDHHSNVMRRAAARGACAASWNLTCVVSTSPKHVMKSTPLLPLDRSGNRGKGEVPRRP